MSDRKISPVLGIESDPSRVFGEGSGHGEDRQLQFGTFPAEV